MSAVFGIPHRAHGGVYPMRFMRFSGALIAALVAAVPMACPAAFYANGKDGLIFILSDNKYCHIDSKTHAHCEDYIGKPLGSLYMSFGGRRPGCVVAFIEEENHKPGQYRWHAQVKSDFAKECHGVWQNNNTLWVYGTEK